jgi:hypothetical protein
VKIARLKQVLRRPHQFDWKKNPEAEPPTRGAQLKARAARKQKILHDAAIKTASQALLRRAERRINGHIVTPLHA